MEYIIVTFATITDAIACDQALPQAGLSGRLIPIPRQLRADCGMVWRGSPADEKRTQEILTAENVHWGEIIHITM